MLETVYVVRHGFRMSWSGRELFAPSGRPRDPVLTAHGISQAKNVAKYFQNLPIEERPEMIISSPYYRCVQTSLPTAEGLGLELMIEPGLTEWFPPAPPSSGLHPSPSLSSTVISQFPSSKISNNLTWSPLLYASLSGENIEELHLRAQKILDLIISRCEARGIKRILICSHAATIIALGRAFLDKGVGSGNDRLDGSHGFYIGAGTATLSKYKRVGEGKVEALTNLENGKKVERPKWRIEMNGNADHLPNGVEREWDFSFVPSNGEEDGMGIGWEDSETPQGSQTEVVSGQNEGEGKTRGKNANRAKM